MLSTGMFVLCCLGHEKVAREISKNHTHGKDGELQN